MPGVLSVPTPPVSVTVSKDSTTPMHPAETPAFPLEELSWECTKNALAVSQYLASQGLPQPSNDFNGPTQILPHDSPEWVQRARQNLMDAALKLFHFAAGPSEFLPNLAPGVQYVACLQWLCRYEIFSLVPQDGSSISYTSLAAAAYKRSSGTASIPIHRLKSIVRMAITAGLFLEAEPNHICHSATSLLLARNPDVHAWASYLSSRSAPTALAMTAAHDRYTASSYSKNETSYNVAFNTELPFFDHISLSPTTTAEFASYMRNVTTSSAMSITHLVNGYDWSALGSAKVVDVGGSTGAAAVALANAYPDLSLVVQDHVDNTTSGSANLPLNLSGRIQFQPHDFTNPQPIKDAQVFLLRMILHDWPDTIAVKILQSLLPAIKTSGGKILIMDTILPPPGRVPNSVERLARVRDMTMLQVFNSHERDFEQWEELLEETDRSLKITRVMQPFGSAMGLLEVCYKDDQVDSDSDDGNAVVQNEDARALAIESVDWDITG